MQTSCMAVPIYACACNKRKRKPANIATKNGLSLNECKTEIVLFSRKPSQHTSAVNSTVPIIPKAKCLGYLWHKSLSARPAVEQNIAKAHRQFFALGSIGCYLGQSNPLSAENCILPTLCYGAENWILDDISLDLLNRFQTELGKCILQLSRFHSHLTSLLALSWPSMAARIHLLKLGFLCRLLSLEHDSLASRTFHTLASQDIYSLSVVQQYIFLDSKLGTNATASILSNTEDPKALLRKAKQAIIKQDNKLRLQVTAKHQSVKLALNINWLHV